jgi:hypothetical protein
MMTGNTLRHTERALDTRMQFGNRPRALNLRKPKSPAPLSVGRHAFVNRAPSLTQKLGNVFLTNESNTQTLSTLADGQEVEILGWRQRPSVHYNVRCLSGGAEGWVVADCLRASRDPLPETSPVADMPKLHTAYKDERQVRSGAPPRGAPAASGVRPVRSTKAAEPARDEVPAACPVCGKEAHPYNLSRDTKGVVVGCYFCSSRRF